MYYTLYHNKSYIKKEYLLLLPLFILQPFIATLSAIFILGANSHNEREYKLLFFVISLFLSLLAFTQKTDVGDISRVYYNIETASYLGIKEYIAYSFITDKYILFSILNQIIYQLTGNVQYISLFWVFILYYCTFLSILNFYKYRNLKPKNDQILVITIACLFCFIMFTQVTEIMKQAVCTSLALLAYSNYLLGNKKRMILIVILACGVHFSIFLLSPIFLSKSLKQRIIIAMVLFSFVCRQFNLMELTITIISKIGGFAKILGVAEYYNADLDGFFDISAPFFKYSYLFYIILTLFTYLFFKRKDNYLINACLLMICVLNINYSVSHNITRMLTMMYPFYLMLIIDLMQNSKYNKHLKYCVIAFTLLITLVFNYRMAYDRLSINGTYPTSFMNNSVLDIVISPSFSYLMFKYN